MLEVIYNDHFTDLSVVVVNGDGSIAVIDSNFKVYSTCTLTPLNIEMATTFEGAFLNALNIYFRDAIFEDENGWGARVRKQSFKDFCEFIEKQLNNGEEK